MLAFNPLNPLEAEKNWRLTHRDHRKLMIVDGRIAFTGGIHITDDYSSRPFGRHPRDSRDEDSTGWRDTHLRIEGPVVAEFQKLFMATWERQSKDPLPPRDYLPKLANRGDEVVRALATSPDSADSAMRWL